MDKLKEKFKASFGIDYTNPIWDEKVWDKKAAACAEIAKELVKKFDEWQRKKTVIYRRDLDKYEIWIDDELHEVTYDELFTIFIEQEKI